MPKGTKKIKKRSKNTVPKPVYKFDVQAILNERQAENERLKKSAAKQKQSSTESKEKKTIDDLFEASVSSIEKCFKSFEEEDYPMCSKTKLVYAIFDNTKYNMHFKNNSDFSTTESGLQQLILMSIEKNEIQANINFNNLLNANWSPVIGVRLDIIYLFSLIINSYLL